MPVILKGVIRQIAYLNGESNVIKLKVFGMKKFIIAGCFCFCGYNVFAQDKPSEMEIKNLEQNEVQAVLNKDTIALKKLWDKDFVVNSPRIKSF